MKLLKDVLEKYRKTISIHKKGYIQESYRIDVIQRSFLGYLFINKISSKDIASYRDFRLNSVNFRTKMPISSSTVRLELSLLSHVFDVARIEWGWVKNNPCNDVRKPKPNPARERRLTPREAKKILDYTKKNPDFYCIIVLALETGMRQGEILSITWENIHLQKRIIHLPTTKNGSKRDVPLSLKARDALLQMKDINSNQTGKIFSYTSSGLKTAWRQMLINLKIDDLHFHDLRHEAVSRLFETNRLDIMEVATISGHKSLNMLKRYTHLKAHRLVFKLDGTRSKLRQSLLSKLLPYPAYFKEEDMLCFPDFNEFYVRGESKKSIVQCASYQLLHKIVYSLVFGEEIPEPDQYDGEYANIIMIDPLHHG